MTQNSFLKIVFLFTFSTTNFIAQNNSDDLKSVWENTKNSDSLRFKALADYYILNNQAQPDFALKVLEYYYQLAKEKNNTKELYNVANDRGGIYLQYFYSSFKIYKNLKEKKGESNMLTNIGSVYL